VPIASARRSPGRLAAAIGLGLVLSLAAVSVTALAAERMRFPATAYADPGDETANGSTARRGVVAADSKVLPFGSRIREGAQALRHEDSGRRGAEAR
jgi:hypothetical protein